MHRQAARQVQGQALRHPRVPLLAIGPGVLLGKDGLRAGLPQQRGQLLERVAAAHDQAAAPGSQAGIQLAQAGQHERHPLLAGIGCRHQHRIQNKYGDDLLGLPLSSRERLIFTQSLVAADPPDCSCHGWFLHSTFIAMGLLTRCGDQFLAAAAVLHNRPVALDHPLADAQPGTLGLVRLHDAAVLVGDPAVEG